MGALDAVIERLAAARIFVRFWRVMRLIVLDLISIAPPQLDALV